MATNVLTDRLARLEANGLVYKMPDPNDGRRRIYRLTEGGKDLIPLLIEMVIWSSKHVPDTAIPDGFLDDAVRDRSALVERLRARLESARAAAD